MFCFISELKGLGQSRVVSFACLRDVLVQYDCDCVEQGQVKVTLEE